MRRLELHTLWLLLATLAALAVLTPAAVAQFPPSQQTSLNISGQADLISPGQIIVYVTVDGNGGVGSVGVNVIQARPPLGANFGFGFTQIICDGQRRTYAVSVFGGGFPGWQLGEAEASASAFCPTSGSDFDTQTIRITRP
jgi:hypothetical protein